MKETLITALRDRRTTCEEFRRAADRLSTLLAIESSELLPHNDVTVETPLAKAHCSTLAEEVVLVPILRSGLTLLFPFLQYYPKARVGFLGERRDEVTAIPELYYQKLPVIADNDSVLILDPMIATAGSAILAVKILKDAGVREEQMTLVTMIGAPEGILRFKKECPKVGFICAQIDQALNAHKFIMPGLGDFGDRYFGTI